MCLIYGDTVCKTTNARNKCGIRWVVYVSPDLEVYFTYPGGVTFGIRPSSAERMGPFKWVDKLSTHPGYTLSRPVFATRVICLLFRSTQYWGNFERPFWNSAQLSVDGITGGGRNWCNLESITAQRAGFNAISHFRDARMIYLNNETFFFNAEIACRNKAYISLRIIVSIRKMTTIGEK